MSSPSGSPSRRCCGSRAWRLRAGCAASRRAARRPGVGAAGLVACSRWREAAVRSTRAAGKPARSRAPPGRRRRVLGARAAGRRAGDARPDPRSAGGGVAARLRARRGRPRAGAHHAPALAPLARRRAGLSAVLAARRAAPGARADRRRRDRGCCATSPASAGSRRSASPSSGRGSPGWRRPPARSWPRPIGPRDAGLARAADVAGAAADTGSALAIAAALALTGAVVHMRRGAASTVPAVE